MSFKIKSLKFFISQLENLDKKSKSIIMDKIELLKENPYRYKRIKSKQYSKVFRVRLSLNGKESRLIYVIIDPNIILCCLLDRKRDYKDLEKYLLKIKKELEL